MDLLTIACALLLTLLMPFSLFASSVDLFFTIDELTEMGVRLEPADAVGAL